MSDFRLKVFLSVAKNLSFTKASKELHITQPAISKHIQELESFYKITLFERKGNSITVTPAGKILQIHADNIIDAYKQISYDMNLISGKFSGELRIGASTTIAQYVMPTLLALFINAFPDIKLSLLSGNSSEIEKALEDHRIDLGLVERNHREPGCKYETFLNDELVLITHTGSIFSKKDEIEINELASLPLVLREYGSGTLEVIENALASHNIKLSSLNVLLQMGNTESIKSFLMQTDSVGIVSIRSVTKDLLAGNFKVIEINGLEFSRNFSFVMHQGIQSGLSEQFIRFALLNKNKL